MVTKISNLKNSWKTVIGLEIHAQMKTKTKLFSIAPYKYTSPTNSNVAYFDMATPGTLPIINSTCIELAIKAATALKCDINYNSEFDRKHYFYGDLPAGYQITQYRQPIARNGKLVFFWDPSENATNIQKSQVNITQMHIEQDSGKSLHDYNQNISMIDLNRAGVGLLEVVTDCQIGCASEAVGFVKELKNVFRECGICSGKMEYGEFRVDVNISVHHQNSKILGERSEVKNINNLRGVLKAIEFESARHIQLLENGQTVVNETRFYDTLTETTLSMRDKENIQDYRYFPEPNLPPLRLMKTCQCHGTQCINSHICVSCIQNKMKHFVYTNEKRFLLVSKFGLNLFQTDTVLLEPNLYEFFESLSKYIPGSFVEEMQNKWLKILSHITLSILLGELRLRLLTYEHCSIKPPHVAELTTMVFKSEINYSLVGKVIKVLLDNPDQSPEEIVKKHNFIQINDPVIIEQIIQDFIQRNPKAFQDYKSGNKRVGLYFIKNIKAENNGKINLKILESMVYQILDGYSL